MRWSQETRARAWDEMVAFEWPRQFGMTDRRVARLRGVVWDDDEFWDDLLGRHALGHILLADLDAATREHCVMNFWGMLYRAAVVSGIIKA